MFFCMNTILNHTLRRSDGLGVGFRKTSKLEGESKLIGFDGQFMSKRF
jgi:hypothetical protein